jgi:hypothetical protein
MYIIYPYSFPESLWFGNFISFLFSPLPHHKTPLAAHPNSTYWWLPQFLTTTLHHCNVAISDCRNQLTVSLFEHSHNVGYPNLQAGPLVLIFTALTALFTFGLGDNDENPGSNLHIPSSTMALSVLWVWCMWIPCWYNEDSVWCLEDLVLLGLCWTTTFARTTDRHMLPGAPLETTTMTIRISFRRVSRGLWLW